MKEVTGGWSKLCKEELYDLYAPAAFCYGNQMKENEMGGAYGMHGRGETHTGVWWEHLKGR